MPNNSVGGVSVSVKLDDKDALQELGKLRRKIEDTQKALSEKREKRDSIAAEMEKAEVAAERARQKVKKLQEQLAAAQPGDRAGVRTRLTEANADLREQTRFLDGLNKQWQKLSVDISTGEKSLDGMTERASVLETEVKANSGAMAKLRSSVASAAKSMQNSFRRLGQMISRVFVFTVILSGLRALRDYLSDLLLSFPEVRDALAEIKGNLMTAAQPVIERIIPAFTTLLQILVQVSAVLADIVAKIFGTTAAQSRESAKALNEQSKAYKKAGSAAQKASRQLASFDQLNILHDNSSSGSAGSDAAGAITPSFDGGFMSELEGKIGALELLLGEAFLVLGAILTFSGVNIPLGIALIALGAASIAAAAGLDWEALKSQMEGPIGQIFTLVAAAALVLGAILTFSGANLPLGIALMVIGAAGLATAAALNWDKIKEELTGPMAGIYAILSVALLVIGGILVFSGISLPLGIALMAAGAAGLVTVTALNWDKIKEELTGPMAGIYAIVAAATLVIGAILVFSGISLPLGIALMAAGAAGLVAVTALNWDKIKQELTGPMAGIYAIVAAATLVIGAILAFSGISLPLGIALMAAGAAGLVAVTALNWDKIKGILQGKFGGIMALISAGLLVLGIILAFAGVLPLGIALIVAGAAGLVTVTALNWDAIKEKIVGVWDSIRTWWQTNVAPIFTVEWWADKFASISEGLRQRVTDGINVAIDLFNRFIDWVNERLNISWKGLSLFGTEVISAGSYQLVTLPRIPRLAQGAVIPPNREFMAVLGDQKSGTNIEAPLETMVQAFRQAMAEGGPWRGKEPKFEVRVFLDSREIKAGQQRLNRAMGV
ncbi:MAG: hypothetical protein IJI97_08855 [Clostridia bacterium]|nr:hypothetical protein [Clostridia bacterium]